MVTNPYIIPADSVSVLHTGHSHVEVLTPPDLVASEGISVMRGTVDGPGVVPLHSHRARESFYVLDGEMEVYQESEGSASWTVVRPGDYVVVPCNSKHAWRNSRSAACVVLIITDSEVTAFLQGSSDIEKAGLSVGEATGKIMDIAATYHLWLATPEQNSAIGITFP